ncbi:zinc ribbon domain-containing protein [Patescibacteria group bacterium]|nr:zinc ribbon domain-containing protein [Patescibacteria group bacterium]
MFCKNCEKQIGDDEKFCGYCGAETIEKISDDRVRYTTPDKNHSGHTDNDFSQKYTTTRDNSGNGEIAVGVIALIIGGALTWITYEAASAGGTYFVFWGLMIYGGYKILKGLAS